MGEVQRLRVMVVDDNPVVADRIAGLIDSDERLQVCDRAESGLHACARIAAMRPDVVLMDLEMPGFGGLAAIKRIKALVAPPAVIVVTLHDAPDIRSQAQYAGADAFIPKPRIGRDLVPALLALLPGGPLGAAAAL